MTSPDENYFSGPERIDVFAPSGGLTRMGEPTELAVSNYDRTLQAFLATDLERAARYVTMQLQGSDAMMTIYAQWPSAYLLAATDRLGHASASALAVAAYRSWLEAAQSIAAEGAMERLVVECATPLLSPERLTVTLARSVIDALRIGETSPHVAATMSMYEQHKRLLLAALDRRDCVEARIAYHEYFVCARAWHDALMQYTEAFPSASADTHGQSIAESLVDQSFKQAPFGAGLWAFAATLSPKQLAAFLLAHLRDHYSGPDRKGSALVVEHTDRYQLIFDPCGSGGAARQRRGNLQPRLPEASAATFGRSSAVPAYCTHCAFNARTSVSRFGWPIYVTEFNPDPMKPCGWTVYKDPHRIPDRYFEEVGCSKEPEKFQLHYWERPCAASTDK